MVKERMREMLMVVGRIWIITTALNRGTQLGMKDWIFGGCNGGGCEDECHG